MHAATVRLTVAARGSKRCSRRVKTSTFTAWGNTSSRIWTSKAVPSNWPIAIRRPRSRSWCPPRDTASCGTTPPSARRNSARTAQAGRRNPPVSSTTGSRPEKPRPKSSVITPMRQAMRRSCPNGGWDSGSASCATGTRTRCLTWLVNSSVAISPSTCSSSTSSIGPIWGISASKANSGPIRRPCAMSCTIWASR